ncbi:LLM class flavin-dependent oxidoreductase [uncultured Jatrophihabitans sp.]|uniref:LLM class flavin-dependent oxidoreductase n=1 Tax=uncultured Jatrophihabitans sp. TaxID=1610747 RepID=UPI0035C961A9
MEFGLLYEWQMPFGVSREDESTHFLQMFEQIKLAEEVGFTTLFSVEHHFLESFSHASAPEVLLAWAAANTTRMRIGHGVRLLPYPYNHPIRAAEQAATLDLLSQGRLEFGTGRSATAAELGGFGIDPAETREMWHESLELILKAWQDPIVEHDGKYFKQPPRTMVPKPLQQPHPPLWMSCTSPESHELAGALGLGLLSFTLALDFNEVASRLAKYRERIKTANPIGAYANDQTAVFVMAHCADTNELARERAEAGVMRYQHDQIELLTSLIPELKEGSSYDYYERFVGVDYDRFTYDYLERKEMILVGDPERCIQLAKKYQEIGVDRLLLFVQYKDMAHEHTMDAIRLFGKEVLPAFS